MNENWPMMASSWQICVCILNIPAVMAISRSFSLFLLFSLTLAESDHLIWEPSECDFVNSNSQCINCKIKEAHQGTFPPKTSDPPKNPTKVQVFLYYPENATNEREDLASGLRFLIQHPNDTERLAGYQIFTDFRTHLDGNVQISTPVKTDVKFDVIYPEDAQIMVKWLSVVQINDKLEIA